MHPASPKHLILETEKAMGLEITSRSMEMLT